MEKQQNQNVSVKFRIVTSCDNCFEESFKENFENEMKNLKISIYWREIENPVQTEIKTLFDDKTIDVIGNIENFENSLKNILDSMIVKWCGMETGHWLVFVQNDFRTYTKFYHHKVELDLFCMGVLTSPTDYVFYHSIDNNLTANFYHDTGILEINNEEYQLKIKYNSIRRILADVKKNSVYIFIDVKYPPPVYREEKRALTLPSVDREIHGNSTVFMIRMNDVKTAKEILSRFRISYNMAVNYVFMKKDIIKKNYPKIRSFDLGQFDCSYNLYAILTRTFAPLEQLKGHWDGFIKELRDEYEDKFILSKALEYILDIQEQGILFDYQKSIKTIYEWFKEQKDLNSITDYGYITPNNMQWIRKLIITPTRKLLYPQEYQYNNRMLRNFSSDYTLRVSFRDDDNLKLNGIANNCDDELLYMAIDKPMLEGITIAGRYYQLLAWSNSQVRDHGVWMYAKDDNGYDVDYIRKFMGDFSRNKSVAKSMARLGQCFSQTEDVKNIPDSAIKTVDDIEGGLNPVTGKPYCFSDGIGKMSLKVSEEVSKKLKLNTVPCGYQIRYAGYKGMLIVDPTLTGTGIDLVFRKSMKKFDSPCKKLEIVKICKAIPVQLNRPMINIMNQLGVPNNVFLEMQEEMLSDITDILIDDEKAADYLTSKLLIKSIGGYKDMVKVGIGLTGDPFFRGMLLCLRERTLLDIKVKARLAVNPDDGRNMFGVLDETGTLEYGQVFVQYTKDIINQETNTETVIYTGPVLVTKNPCTQPGDIRLLEAIDVPELHHLVNCVAFPQKGPRPHPNEMAGSDLDGDEYAVIWKKDLFFSENREPENFPSPPETKHPDGKFNLQESVKVLSDYIRNDQIGTIGNAHLAISDLNGLDIDVCKDIARKFSLSLDYVKSGYFEPLKLNEKPKKFPDFMDRGIECETYISQRALGELYRNCKLFEQNTTSIELETIDLTPDLDLIHEGWEKYEESARKSKEKYNYLLQYIMQRYGVQTEVEMITGAFRQLHERHSQRHDKTDVEKFLIIAVENLQERFRDEFYSEFGITGNDETSSHSINLTDFQENILKKASAWYAVTYYKPSDTQNPTRFLSFPWIVWKHLVTIKMRKSFNVTTVATSILTILDERLLNMAKKLKRYQSETLLLDGNQRIPKRVIEYTYRLIIGWLNRKNRLNNENQMWLARYFNTFLDKNCYSNEEKVEPNIKTPNIINICFAFLKAIRNESSFPYNLKWIPSYARETYHLLAATGNPKAFCPIEDVKNPDEIVELAPIRLLMKIIPGEKNKRLNTLREIIDWLVQLNCLTLRVDEKTHVMILAKGPFKSITFLQELFSMDTETLQQKLEEWCTIISIKQQKTVQK